MSLSLESGSKRAQCPEEDGCWLPGRFNSHFPAKKCARKMCKEKTGLTNTNCKAQSVALHQAGPGLATSCQGKSNPEGKKEGEKKTLTAEKYAYWANRNMCKYGFFFTSKPSEYYLCSVNCMYCRIFSEHSSCVYI